MTTLTLISTLSSMIVLFGFTALSVVKFGWQKSYSTYAHLWHEKVPLASNTHLWSIVTIAAAFLVAPAILQAGDESPWQFLGFFVPCYLMVVGCTPRYLTDKKQRIIHTTGAILCAVAAFAWMILVLRLWYIPLITIALAWLCLYFVNHNDNPIFWGEMAMFSATYVSLLMSV